jgi:pteridine reductase
MTDSTDAAPVVLITGAARRIGAQTARVFHQHGYRVIVHYHHSQADAMVLQQTLNAQRPNSAQVLCADLNDPTAVVSMARDAIGFFQRLDVLINNASAFYPTPLGETTEAYWHDLINTNAKAPLFLIQSLAPKLREVQGSIVNLTDINADRGMSGFGAYTMAKAALKAMTKSLARELAPAVRVNAVSPGAILWPEHLSGNANDPMPHADAQARMLAGIPMGRLGSMDDIANTVFFWPIRLTT